MRYLTLEAHADDYTSPPGTDDRDLVALVPDAVDRVLEIAETWLAWDRRPVLADGNVWTPHKALRRVADHLLDHLAELDCRMAGLPALPDRWHGRRLTLDADWARFTEADLDEATSRLTRLAQCYRVRLSTVDASIVDAATGNGAWTLRQVVHHVAKVTAYAEMIGRLPG